VLQFLVPERAGYLRAGRLADQPARGPDRRRRGSRSSIASSTSRSPIFGLARAHRDRHPGRVQIRYRRNPHGRRPTVFQHGDQCATLPRPGPARPRESGSMAALLRPGSGVVGDAGGPEVAGAPQLAAGGDCDRVGGRNLAGPDLGGQVHHPPPTCRRSVRSDDRVGGRLAAGFLVDPVAARFAEHGLAVPHCGDRRRSGSADVSAWSGLLTGPVSGRRPGVGSAHCPPNRCPDSLPRQPGSDPASSMMATAPESAAQPSGFRARRRARYLARDPRCRCSAGQARRRRRAPVGLRPRPLARVPLSDRTRYSGRTGMSSERGWWPGAGSNRRPSDFQKTVDVATNGVDLR
jgi:hypothetical protein